MTLKGKTALVTGSTSGIGLGIAQVLAGAGANILLNGFGDPASALAEIARHGVKVIHHPADLSDVAQIEALFALAEREFGGVDIWSTTRASSTWRRWSSSLCRPGTRSSR